MKNYEIYLYNEQMVNAVAAVGNDEQAQRMAEVINGKDNVEFYDGGNVKMCYPYGRN